MAVFHNNSSGTAHYLNCTKQFYIKPFTNWKCLHTPLYVPLSTAWSPALSQLHRMQAHLHPNVLSTDYSSGVHSMNCKYTYSISFWNLWFFPLTWSRKALLPPSTFYPPHPSNTIIRSCSFSPFPIKIHSAKYGLQIFPWGNRSREKFPSTTYSDKEGKNPCTVLGLHNAYHHIPPINMTEVLCTYLIARAYKHPLYA